MPNPITVLIHLTGLLVVVPPKGSGDMTYVVMAEPTTEPHVAQIGFEAATNRPGLCKHHQQGICYVEIGVNTGDWSLEPVGAGGTTQMPGMGQLPRGLVNLTRGSGGNYRVDTSALGNRALARFGSGRPSVSYPPCSLAEWTYKPNGAPTAETVYPANVVSWEMELPQSSFQLVFKRVGGTPNDTAIVTLTPSGKPVEIVAAYLPVNDMARLRAGTPNLPPVYTAGTPADHFHDLYNPLRVPPDPALRPVPRFVKLVRPLACTLKLSSPVEAFIKGRDAVDTHSCMLAAAEAQ